MEFSLKKYLKKLYAKLYLTGAFNESFVREKCDKQQQNGVFSNADCEQVLLNSGIEQSNADLPQSFDE